MYFGNRRNREYKTNNLSGYLSLVITDDINTQVDDSSNTWPLIFLIFVTSDLLHSIVFIYSFGYTLNHVIILVHI